MGIAPAVSHVASNRNINEQQRVAREDYERGSQDNLSLDAYSKRARYAATKREADLASREGNTYLGENGAGENKTWVRQGGHVSFDGAQPELMNAVDMLAKFYYDRTGKKLVVTAGTNGQHAAGWKVDIGDFGGGEVGANEDGPLTTADFRKGKFADEFIAYGRSLGLGMNWEGDGTSNVHIDVALDGTQWEGNGDHAGGFNPRGIKNTSQKSSTQENSYDNNFSDRQNEIWQMAQYVSVRAKEKYNIDIPAWLIYRH